MLRSALLFLCFAMVSCSSSSSNGPVTLASNQVEPFALTLDASNLYWVGASEQHGGLYQMSKSGGSVTTLYSGALGLVESIAVDGTSVYFPLGTTIVAVPIGGGAPVVLAQDTSTNAVALANGKLYWIETSQDPQAAAVAKSVAIGGGTVTTIALPSGAGNLGGAQYITAATDAVYAALSDGANGIVRIPLDSGAATNLTTTTPITSPQVLAVDDTDLYFTDTQAVSSISVAGGSPTTLATGASANGVCVDSSSVFFAEDLPAGRILKVAKNGGTPVVLAEKQGAPHALAVDDQFVYWDCDDDGTVMKVAK